MARLMFFLAVLMLPLTVWAAAPDALPDGGRGKVIAVIDGDTVRVEGIKADVRLVGIQAPKLPLGRKGFKTWPMADDAKRALEDIVKGHTLTLRLGATARDRNGRTLAHLVREDGMWVQEEMLKRGMARVYTFADNRQLTTELFATERAARAQRAGLWDHAFYAVRGSDPHALAKDAGTFQVVEGKIVDAAKVQGRVFLNFGDDYRTDFTATIVPEAVAMFTKSGVDPLALQGKVVRVRGYLRNFNGPNMDLTHPEQIEVTP
jgi:micrococcal nuclease